MVFHFYRGNLRGGLFFHAQAEDQCKNAGMQKYIFTTFLILFRSNILCNAKNADKMYVNRSYSYFKIEV